jgi:hypothetical protein
MCCTVNIARSERVYKMRASNLADRDAWVRAIQDSIVYHQRRRGAGGPAASAASSVAGSDSDSDADDRTQACVRFPVRWLTARSRTEDSSTSYVQPTPALLHAFPLRLAPAEPPAAEEAVLDVLHATLPSVWVSRLIVLNEGSLTLYKPDDVRSSAQVGCLFYSDLSMRP